MFNLTFLHSIGWKPFFQQQLSLSEFEQYSAARVIAVYRDHISCLSESGNVQVPLLASMPNLVTGDWLLLNDNQQFVRLLERFSLIERKSAGSQIQRQLMVANIDTLFIVSSLNQDFSLNRIERYLAVAKETQIAPVVILTKKDLCEQTFEYVQQVKSMDPGLPVYAVNGLDSESLTPLQAYCKSGNTVAVMGSSGVGKSTLINGLSDDAEQATDSIRESDGKGKHTTTMRNIIPLTAGGVLIDTPGMRELQVVNCKEGIQETFADIEALAKHCKFGDCQHQSEPGCAIQQAISKGEVEQRRFDNYRKLLAEEAHNSASIAEKRQKDRQLSKLYRTGKLRRELRKEGIGLN